MKYSSLLAQIFRTLILVFIVSNQPNVSADEALEAYLGKAANNTAMLQGLHYLRSHRLEYTFGRSQRYLVVPLSQKISPEKLKTLLPIVLKLPDGRILNPSHFGTHSHMQMQKHPTAFRNTIFQTSEQITKTVNSLVFTISARETAQSGSLQSPLTSNHKREITWDRTAGQSNSARGSKPSTGTKTKYGATPPVSDKSLPTLNLMSGIKVKLPGVQSYQIIGIGKNDQIILRDRDQSKLFIYIPETRQFKHEIAIPANAIVASSSGKLIIHDKDDKDNDNFSIVSLESGKPIQTFKSQLSAQVLAIMTGWDQDSKCWLLTRPSNTSSSYGYFHIMDIENGRIHAKMPARSIRIYKNEFNYIATPNLSHVYHGRYRYGFDRQGIWREESLRNGGSNFLTADLQAFNHHGSLLYDSSRPVRQPVRISRTNFYPIRNSSLMIKNDYRSHPTIHDRWTNKDLAQLDHFLKPTASKTADKDHFYYNAVSGNFYYFNFEEGLLRHYKKPLQPLLSRTAFNYADIINHGVPPMIQGEVWQCRLSTRTKKDDQVTYQLLDKPSGMTIQDGLIKWQVPTSQLSPPTIKVSIRTKATHRTLDIPATVHRRSEDKTVLPIQRLANMTPDQQFIPLSNPVRSTHVINDGHQVVVVTQEDAKDRNEPPKLDEAIVIDLVKRKIIYRTSVDHPEALITAGGDNLAIYHPDSEKLYLHDFGSGKVTTFSNPLTTKPQLIAMGYNRGDRLFIAGEEQAAMVSFPSGQKTMFILPELKDSKLSFSRKYPHRANHDLSKILYTTNHTYLLKFSDDKLTVDFSKHYSGGENARLWFGHGEIILSKYSYRDINSTKMDRLMDYRQYVQPILGSSLYHLVNGNEIKIYQAGDADPLFSLSQIPSGRDFRRSRRVSGYGGSFFSRISEAGFIIPKDASGVVVTPYFNKAFNTKPILNLPVSATARLNQTLKIPVILENPQIISELSLENNPVDMTINDKTLTWNASKDFDAMNVSVIATSARGITRKKIRILPEYKRMTDQRTWQSGKAGLLAIKETDKLAFSPTSRFIAAISQDSLFCVDARTLIPVKRQKLAHSASHIAIRNNEVMIAGRDRFASYTMPDLKLVCSVALPGLNVKDLVPHPVFNRCYMTVDRTDVKDQRFRQQVMVINQSTQTRSWTHKPVYGTFLAFTPDGKHLISLLSNDIISSQQMMRYGRPLTYTRTMHSTNLIKYSVDGLNVLYEYEQSNWGHYPSQLRMAPDGKRFSPIFKSINAQTGMRNINTGVPAIAVHDFKIINSEFNLGRKPVAIAYHPYLPVTACASEEMIRTFDAITGKKREDYLISDMELKKIVDIQFGHESLEIVEGVESSELLLHAEHVNSDIGHVIMRMKTGIKPTQGKRYQPVSRQIAKAIDKTTPGNKPIVESAFRRLAKNPLDLTTLNGFLKRPSIKAKQSRQIAKESVPAIVEIKHDDGSGTGFLISDKGHILTCSHVLPRPDKKINVSIPGDSITSHTAEIIAQDSTRDLAIIKINIKKQLPYLVIDKGGDIEMGQKVAVIGNPAAGKKILSNTMTTGIVSNPKRILENQQFIQTNAAVNPGMSGSPLLDASGNVIGMINMKANIEAVGFAIPSSHIVMFLLKCSK